jgi:hypothetical protein
MTRHSGALPAPVTVWNEIGAAIGGLRQFLVVQAGWNSNLQLIERESARIRSASRHWLMG